MNLREAIEQAIERFSEDVRSAVFADDKTPLPNAIALREEADRIDDGSSKYDVVVFGDLNRFKGLNDSYGHEAGNIAINQAGENLYRLAIEKLQAQAFRHSGDEFVLLLQQAKLKDFISETSSFSEISFTHGKESLKTAMSFGYAINDGSVNFDELLKRAEMACQYAKDRGDGACVGWSEEMQRNPLVNLRDRCQKCGAKISCNVPKQNAPAKLKSCPCCDKSL
ncbi:MAG: GGDEF domain-containing protein [Pyrinomonadaceae bacterium]